MAFSPQQLSDLEEIKVLKHRYFRGLDTANGDLLGDLFTDDVSCSFNGGSYKVSLTGRATLLEFLANSFHSGAVAMHIGVMPEITFTGTNTAVGAWYLQDLFIDLEKDVQTFGTAIYADEYLKENNRWKICSTRYDRIIEILSKFSAKDSEIRSHFLANVGRKPHERTDVSDVIQWS